MASHTPQQPPPLSPGLYDLQEDEIDFFKAQTGIQDDQELREHITNRQAEAYEVYPYTCIRTFSFTTLKISKHPAYKDALKIGRERPDAIFLDLGCCFGNDARKAIADGFPRQNVLASDLRPEFWELGHKLFKSSPETFPVPFLAGDIFNAEFLSPTLYPVPTSDIPPPPPPPLYTLISLTPLYRNIAVIHTSSFFHLFSEPQQRTLAHLLGALLSPLPGSMILGSHAGLPDTPENREGNTRPRGRGGAIFAHSPTSWEKLWKGEGGVFRPGDVAVWSKVVEIERKDTTPEGNNQIRRIHLHFWSVTRT